jgi:hypothetical protein
MAYSALNTKQISAMCLYIIERASRSRLSFADIKSIEALSFRDHELLQQSWNRC